MLFWQTSPELQSLVFVHGAPTLLPPQLHALREATADATKATTRKLDERLRMLCSVAGMAGPRKLNPGSKDTRLDDSSHIAPATTAR
jgi:hypothetical protein